jgi:hypothetical protein
MKSQALQDMVQKIHSDEATRTRFLADPNSVISEYDLTETEKKAVLSTHIKLGLVSTDQQIDPVIHPMGAWM